MRRRCIYDKIYDQIVLPGIVHIPRSLEEKMKRLLRRLGLKDDIHLVNATSWPDFVEKVSYYGCREVVACIKALEGRKILIAMTYQAVVSEGLVIQLVDRTLISPVDIAAFPEVIRAETLVMIGRTDWRRRQLRGLKCDAILTVRDPHGNPYSANRLRAAADLERLVAQGIPLCAAYEVEAAQFVAV